MSKILIRDECFRLAAASPVYVVHHFRHPGGAMEFSIEDEKNGWEYHLGIEFTAQMLATLPPNSHNQRIIQYCIDAGAIPHPVEEYIY